MKELTTKDIIDYIIELDVYGNSVGLNSICLQDIHERLKLLASHPEPQPQETYRKIYIKSEADLPKEDGRYFSYDKVHGIETQVYYQNTDNGYWLRHIDWYLQPVQESQLKQG